MTGAAFSSSSSWASGLRGSARRALAVGCLVWLAAGGAQAFEASAAAGAGRSATARRPALSLVELELPLSFRFQMGGVYTRSHSASEALSFRQAAPVGPAMRRPRLIESRVSLTHALWEGLELGVAWTSHSELSGSQLLEPDRQVVGAFLRFVTPR